jgi:acetyl-CoA synthetase
MAGAGPQRADQYAVLHSRFRWQVDTHFNIAQACCQRWAAESNGKGPSATPSRTAIRIHRPGAAGRDYSYADLQHSADALSLALGALGVRRGDRVAIVLPQCFETAVAYMAVLQMGAVAMPLSILFGPDALEFRLQDSEAVLAIADENAMASLKAVRPNCPALRTLLAAGKAQGQGDMDYSRALAAHPGVFTAVKTLAEDPAILIYTSGTTGQPKGALLAHRALIGNLPGFVASQNWFGFDGKNNTSSQAVFWSPADWAWTGGLMDALLPTLYFGRTIVAYSGRFSPQTALELMRDCGVTHTFIFPTALKAMMKANGGSAQRTVRQQFRLKLQAIMSAGEAVGDAVFTYCEKQLGVKPNEMFGQTEINYIVGNCNALWPSKPGSMGMGYPGHRVAVIDDAGQECAVGVPGDVALNRLDVHGQPDPIFFLGYWKNEASTRAKYTGKNGEGEWCRTGDLAVRAADGYLWYQGRSDDVFKAAGYRIGPGEIENCLVKHPAVINAAVVPKPDPERGALVKAYVVIAPDFVATYADNAGARARFHAQLTLELQAHVKGLLAPYEYPKEIEYVDALPMTTTGKVQRRVLRLQEEARAAARGPAPTAGISRKP